MDKREKKENNNRDKTVLMHRGQVNMLSNWKLKVLTPQLDCRRLKKPSVVTICSIRVIQNSQSKFLRERLRSRSVHMFREEICCYVLRVHSTY